MTQAHGHAATSIQPPQSPEMDVARGQQKLQDNSSTLQCTDEETIASKEAGGQRHRHKQNPDYVLRTGLAGGLAACAVCYSTCNIQQEHPLISIPGQNRCRTPRPCQDPFPGLQPPIRKIYRLVVWRSNSNARHQPARWHTRSFPRPLRNTPPYLPLWLH